MNENITNPYNYLLAEARSLLSRLKQVKPFSMTMPMVRGASVSVNALKAVTELLEKGKKELHDAVSLYIQRVDIAPNDHPDIRKLQTEFTLLKLRYNSILDQLDIFADVLTQRCEHDVGIWLSGLDVLAEDGLTACKKFFDPPPLMVFLQRGHGAAIRRARTRLPGGDENPVAVIQMPRERLVGSGIGASLIHEVGHEAAESLELTKLLRIQISNRIKSATRYINGWRLYERWISEILADCWAIGHLGISATLGLMGVVTLPEYFQFRLDEEDPHPAPWVRVKLSCAFGQALYPHGQWQQLWDLWNRFYPTGDLPQEKKALLDELHSAQDEFINLVLQFRPEVMKGLSVAEIFPSSQRQPEMLQQIFQQWRQKPLLADSMAPTLLFAVMGQAKFDKLLDARDENSFLTQQLRNWAYNRN